MSKKSRGATVKVSLKDVPRRNPMAFALMNPLFSRRIVRSAKIYNRKMDRCHNRDGGYSFLMSV